MEISEEDKKLLEAFHALAVKPKKIESPEDLVSFIRHAGAEFAHSDPHSAGTIPKATTGYPRISSFYGEDNKGEVNWQTFKFEVDSLRVEGVHSAEQILLGIRRAVKGNASDILRRLGTGVGIHEIMAKLESTFGNIESEESILRKFYACQQDATENVVSYASRLEEICSRAVALGGMPKHHDEILRKVFYQGLRRDIKQLAFHKCDAIRDYDRFKIEVRKIEADLLLCEKESSTKQRCHAAVNVEKKEKSELTEVKELLQQLNTRISKLEQEREEKNENRFDHMPFYRGGRGSRYIGFSGRQGPDSSNRGERFGRGRPGYRPFRQTGTNTMQPTCYKCQEKGHIARYCPNE